MSNSEANDVNDAKDGNPNTNEVNDANDTKDGIPNASEANDAKEGNLNTSEANDLTTDFSEDRQRTPCEVQAGPEQDLSELDKKISEQFSENSRNVPYSKDFVNKRRVVHKEGEFYSHKPLNSHLLFTKMHKEFPPFANSNI